MDYITGGSCGVPPYDWIAGKIALEFGYKIGDDKAPLIEYYAYFDPSRNKHEFCYLCVPVMKEQVGS